MYIYCVDTPKITSSGGLQRCKNFAQSPILTLSKIISFSFGLTSTDVPSLYITSLFNTIWFPSTFMYFVNGSDSNLVLSTLSGNLMIICALCRLFQNELVLGGTGLRLYSSKSLCCFTLF